MTASLIAYATYLPRYRLAGGDVGLRRGDRVVASYDEDSTTMAVAAAARALEGHPLPTSLYFATSSPAYADKTNATAIHAALGLPYASFATDLCGTGRSGFAAWRAAAATGGLALTADIRVADLVLSTNASVATAPLRCCSATDPRSPTSSPPRRTRPSFSTVGDHPDRSPVSSGRSGSARTATRP